MLSINALPFSACYLCCSLHGLHMSMIAVPLPLRYLHLAVQFVRMHLLANFVCAQVSGPSPDSDAPKGSALPGCDAHHDCPATDQLPGLIQCCVLAG